ncbi:TNFAIP3-interacting protein 1-like [Pempheris klunzingeri]|uniref:TNFAIP3-interacting protein 1-like n=1 Tax=Pempheris klunzingeri TaxID=3127111 RepID=UPI0039811428
MGYYDCTVMPSRHQDTKDTPPVVRRLYPSLPNVDRYEVCVPNCSSREKVPPAAVCDPDSLQSEVSAARGDARMKAQILILEEQRQELLSINEKWAKEYRTMRQYYKERVQDLKALLHHHHLEEETSEETLSEKLKCKKVTDKESAGVNAAVSSLPDTIYSALLRAEKEAKELRAQNSTLIQRERRQHDEIRRLNKTLEEALQSTQPRDLSGETPQDVWRHQAEVYKEDFLKERRDREKLKGKYLELEKKFRKVHSELRVLKPQVVRTPQSVLECTCTNGARCPDWEVRPLRQHHVQLQRRCTPDNKP